MQTARFRYRSPGRPFPKGPPRLTVHRHRIVFWLLLLILALLALSILGQLAKHVLGYPTGLGLISLFYVDDESNLPTWYQSCAYLFAGILLALIARLLLMTGERFGRHWAVLSAIFVFLSLDEIGSLHERTIEPLQRLIGTPEGTWAPTWVIPALVLVTIFGLAYLRFFFHFSGQERFRVVLAAVLLVGGAVGLEMVNASLDLGAIAERKNTLAYALLSHVEEAFEMLGLLVFIDFLLRRLTLHAVVRLSVVDEFQQRVKPKPNKTP